MEKCFHKIPHKFNTVLPLSSNCTITYLQPDFRKADANILGLKLLTDENVYPLNIPLKTHPHTSTNTLRISLLTVKKNASII